MINAMAAQQHMYTAAAAYSSLEAAAYAQYPQYVTQVCGHADESCCDLPDSEIANKSFKFLILLHVF